MNELRSDVIESVELVQPSNDVQTDVIVENQATDKKNIELRPRRRAALIGEESRRVAQMKF